jgi:hypothetical protein
MTVARSECGKAGEQRASLQERRFMVDHRAACDGDNGSRARCSIGVESGSGCLD